MVVKTHRGVNHLNKQALVILTSVLATGLAAQTANSTPKQTTKYIYYSITGDTPASIYTTLIKRGPRVGGVKAYASTTAVSSQTGLVSPGKFCSLKDYTFKIDFTINLPKLKNEAALDGTTRREWSKFSRFLRTHEETHRKIWLACGADLESKVLALKAKSCTELNAKSIALWNQTRASCTKKQNAFDVAEQARLLRHPFVKLVLSRGSKTQSALAVIKKK